MLRHRIRHCAVTLAIFASSCHFAFGQASVLTQHNDLSRTGQNLLETALTQKVVASPNFGKMFSLSVDGEVESQPLYVAGLTVGGVSHNVVFITTQHDSVYAFDGDVGGAPLWQASLLDSLHGAGANAVPNTQSQTGCYVPNGEYGISGTPVIDPATNTLYVVSVTLENNYPVDRLHALDLFTGAEKLAGPVVIGASVAGTGLGSSNQMLAFDPGVEYQRAGLTLLNGKVYVAFSSFCDLSDFHGWLFAYDAANLTQNAVLLTTPNGAGSSIWMGGGAPAVDAQDRMFIATGNGTFDATGTGSANLMDYGDDILSLDISSGIKVEDSFTPYNQSALSAADKDLGSSTPLILPDQPGLYPHLLLQPSKAGTIFLVNRDQMGGYASTTNNVVQEIDNQVGASSGVAYWNGNVYLWPARGPLTQFQLSGGILSATPSAISSQVQGKGIGSTPSISANGNADPIVWTVDWSNFGQQVLYAHDATNVANMLWSSAGNAAQDDAGPSVKFPVPTIAGGRVYVGTIGQVNVYGLRSSVAQTISFGSVAKQSVGVPLALVATASSGLAISFSSSTTAVCTLSGSTATFLGAGICAITATQAGNSIYAAASPVLQQFSVFVAQSITFGPIANQAPGTPLILTATASSGLAVSYASSTASVCTVAMSTVTFLTPGMCTLTASQAGNSSYTAAVAVSQTFSVGAQTITFGAIANQTVGTPLVLAAMASSALAVSYVSATATVCTVAMNTATLLAPGICTITASQAGNSSYSAASAVSQSFNVFNAQTIAFSSIANQAVGTPFSLNASASSLLPVSYSSSTIPVCSVLNSIVTFVAGGTCTITALQPGNSTFAAAMPVSQTFTVSGPQVIAFDSIASQTTGTTLTLAAKASSGLAIGYSSSTASVCTVAGGIVSFVTAGICSITASQAGSNSYTAATPVTQSFSVLNRQTITFGMIAGQSVGSTLTPAAIASSGLAVSFTSSTISVCTVSGGVATFVVAGSCTLTASQSGNSSYAAAVPVSQTFNVTAAAGPTPYVGYVAFWGIGNSTVTISWSTDAPSTTQVAYGTTNALGQVSSLQTSLAASHGVVLTGLYSGTTYYFVAQSASASGATGYSSTYSFTTTGTPSGPAPIISAVTSTNIASTSATITWTTDQPSSSQVNYGASPSYGTSSTLDNSLITHHSVTLSGLIASTSYNFDVVSANSSGTGATSTNYTFSTAAPAPTPVVSNVTATSISNTSESITWTTDLASSSMVNYGAITVYDSSSPVDVGLATSHSVTLTSLVPGTTYNFNVVSTGSAGGQTISANATFSTTGTPVTPVISNVTTTGITTNAVTITWTTDQATLSMVKYGTTMAYGSSSTAGTALVTSHSVTLAGLNANTTYNFVVVSSNAVGTSATSPNSSFVTAAATGPAPQVGYVAFWGVNNSGVTISWSTDSPATTQVAYGTTNALGQLTPLQTSLAASHGVLLTGLSSGTTYYFVAQSSSAAGTTGYSTTYSFTTTGTPPAGSPPVISAVTSINVTGISATITWTTDQPSSSLVNYGTTNSYGSSSALNSDLVTSHSISLTRLTTGTSYNFDVVSTNSSAVSSTSANYTLSTTAPAGTAPLISAVAAVSITGTSATITWTTDQATSSQVNYGITTAYGSASVLNPTLSTSHSVTLTGLAGGTSYQFQVVSVNGSGNSSASINATFTTVAGSATPPYVGYVAYWGVNNGGVTISWSTDMNANTQVAYGTTAALGQLSPIDTTLSTSHGVVLTGLNPGTTYYFVAQSAVAGGATGYSSTYHFTTTGTATTPTPVISGVAASSANSTGVTITWTTDQACLSLVNYGTTTSYGSTSTPNITPVTSHSVNLSALTPGTTYNFDVISVNSAGASSTSTDYTFTTASAPGGPLISTVAATSVGNNAATITWTTDQASTSQVNYGTAASYGSSSATNMSLVTSHSVAITGLTAGTTYNFDVVSTNSLSSASTSPNYTFTTTGTAPIPVISQVADGVITSSSVTITWTTDQATSSLVNYGTTMAYGSSSAISATLVTSHSVTLSGLAAGTTYDFEVVSANAAGASASSLNSSFTTSIASGPAPSVSYVNFWGVSASGVIISWSTDVSSTTQVAYGTTTGLGQSTSLQSAPGLSHGVTLSGLSPGTTYYFVAQSTASNGSTGYSAQYSFTTTGSTLPIMTGIVVAPVSGNTATISWTTSLPTMNYVQYGPTAGSYNRYSAQTSLTTTPSCVLGYVPSGVVHYQLVSTDASGNQVTSPDATFIEP